MRSLQTEVPDMYNGSGRIHLLGHCNMRPFRNRTHSRSVRFSCPLRRKWSSYSLERPFPAGTRKLHASCHRKQKHRIYDNPVSSHPKRCSRPPVNGRFAQLFLWFPQGSRHAYNNSCFPRFSPRPKACILTVRRIHFQS